MKFFLYRVLWLIEMLAFSFTGLEVIRLYLYILEYICRVKDFLVVVGYIFEGYFLEYLWCKNGRMFLRNKLM